MGECKPVCCLHIFVGSEHRYSEKKGKKVTSYSLLKYFKQIEFLCSLILSFGMPAKFIIVALVKQ